MKGSPGITYFLCFLTLVFAQNQHDPDKDGVEAKLIDPGKGSLLERVGFEHLDYEERRLGFPTLFPFQLRDKNMRQNVVNRNNRGNLLNRPNKGNRLAQQNINDSQNGTVVVTKTVLVRDNDILRNSYRFKNFKGFPANQPVPPLNNSGIVGICDRSSPDAEVDLFKRIITGDFLICDFITFILNNRVTDAVSAFVREISRD